MKRFVTPAAVRRFISLGIVALLLLAPAFAAACSPDDGGAEPDDGRLALTIRSAGGETARLRVEIADDVSERQTGLSNRSELGRDQGMLFVIPQRGLGFWMKDTLIPLSVAFIDKCGEIVAIADMQPQSLDLHNTERPYLFGLEVNQGWFAEHKIGVGARVALPAGLRQPSC